MLPCLILKLHVERFSTFSVLNDCPLRLPCNLAQTLSVSIVLHTSIYKNPINEDKKEYLIIKN